MDYKEKVIALLNSKELSKEQKEKLEDIFPELKESEDENVRKSLIQYVRNWIAQGKNRGCVFHTWTSDEKECNEILAWLEKQGEKESDPRYKYLEELLAADDIYQMAMNDGMVEEAKTKAIYALSKLEIGKLLGFEKKQGEQMPDDKVVKFNVGDKVYNIKDKFECTIESIDDTTYYCDTTNFDIKDQNNWELVEQKPAWSKEDACLLDNCISLIEDIDCTEKEQNWLKGIKDRVQPKQEWSEEDEKMCQETIDWFEKKCFPYALESENPARESIKWLKSLKDRVQPQSQWKPSEEMLEALYRAIPENVMAISKDEMLLDKLYQGLKYGRVLSKN